MVSFEQKVWKACKQIPRGKVSTYSAIAKAIGSPRSSRAVGNALNKNPLGFGTSPHKMVPCHRVVKNDGSVGGYAHGTKRKEAILKKEGVKISSGKIDLKKYLKEL